MAPLSPAWMLTYRVGMRWHHQARLAYYAGEFPRALALFATEWTLRSRLDATRDARLVGIQPGCLRTWGS